LAIIENRWHILGGETVGGVANKHTRLANCAVAYTYTLYSCHIFFLLFCFLLE
jgi:hypothetical protein